MNTMSATKAHLGEATFSRVFGGISPRQASPLHATMHMTEAGPALVLTYLQASNPTIMGFLSELSVAYPVGGDVQGQIGGTA